jgi:CubicO group peptidase (beta-lactamase class C family)
LPSPVSASPFDLGPALGRIVERCAVPGLAALVLQGDRITASGVAGLRRRGAPRPLEPADRFHLGSCTKAMTATLVGRAIDAGRLTWTASVAELLAGVVPQLAPAWRAVAVHHLLAHRSGLPANPPSWSLAPARARVLFRARPRSLRAERLAVIRPVLAGPPRTPPGAAYEYSNTGYIVAGVILETVFDQPWEQLMLEQLWRPLGLASGGFGAPGHPRQVDAPWGHAPAGRPVAPGSVAADWRVPPLYGPAGTAHLSLPDWATFVGLHLRAHAANPRRHVRLLRPETFALLHTPEPGEAYVGGWEFALRPWARGDRSGDRGLMLHHDGSNGQWYAVTRFAPELDLAFLVATNQNGAPGLEACERALKLLGDLASLAG